MTDTTTTTTTTTGTPENAPESATKTDYLAICTVHMGAGGYGRSEHAINAIDICKKEAAGVIDAFGGLKEAATLHVALYDARGHDKVWWDDRGAFGGAETPLPLVAMLSWHVKPKRKRARR